MLLLNFSGSFVVMEGLQVLAHLHKPKVRRNWIRKQTISMRPYEGRDQPHKRKTEKKKASEGIGRVKG